MKQNYFMRFLILASVLLMTITSCALKTDQKLSVENLLEYSIKIEKGIFSPKQVAFGMTIDEILQEKNFGPNDISEDAELGKRIIQTVDIAGLSDKMTIIYWFHEDKLTTVEYILAASDREKATVCNSLYEQAKKQLPTPSVNSLEDVKKGKNTVTWWDKEQNSISISYPTTADSESNIISVSISMAKESK